jgi:hypothetical protein
MLVMVFDRQLSFQSRGNARGFPGSRFVTGHTGLHVQRLNDTGYAAR